MRNRGPAQGREDVPVDLAAVAVPRAGLQCQALAGKPPGGEVRAEAQAPDVVVAAVDLGGQPCCEPFRLDPIGAGRMPDPPLASGDRIEAVVDHRVPAVALLRDVALHRRFSFRSSTIETR